jgi:drug/metabolite transporter (DMT)-like permease
VLVRRGGLRRWSGAIWRRFLALGLGFYVVGNGALLVGLQDLPATTAALLLSLVPLLVLLGGRLWLQEVPTRRQGLGVVIALAGSALFFARGLATGEPRGLAIVAVGLLGNASLGLGGRALARTDCVDTLALTTVPLALGAGILLPVALGREGSPHFTLSAWGWVACLGVLNTAGAYLLYNHALRVLAAFELSTLLTLTPLVTAVGAWLVLGERLSLLQGLGLVVVIGGVTLVQRAAVPPTTEDAARR